MSPAMIASHFETAKEHVRWADEAIEEFRTAAALFFKSNATVMVVEFDPKTRESVKKVRLVKPLPNSLARKATEALNNIRGSFDQATFAARNLTSGPSNSSIYYPWSQCPKDLDRILKSRGIDERLWETFAAHEPYPRADTHSGGDDLIRSLAIIANKKHTVGLAVSGAVSGVAFPPVIRAIPPTNRTGSISLGGGRWDPVKNEIELVRWVGNMETEGNYEVAFQVLLKDPRLPKGVRARPALEAFSTKAKEVIETLEARCLELAGG